MEFTRCIQKGPIKFYGTARPINIRADNCKILWKPNIFGGDGTELNCNICMTNLNETVINNILDLEKKCLTENHISCIKNDHVKSKINSGGLVDAKNLTTQTTKVFIKAGGIVDVFATALLELDLKAGGEANVHYKTSKIVEKITLGGVVNYLYKQ